MVSVCFSPSPEFQNSLCSFRNSTLSRHQGEGCKKGWIDSLALAMTDLFNLSPALWVLSPVSDKYMMRHSEGEARKNPAFLHRNKEKEIDFIIN